MIAFALFLISMARDDKPTKAPVVRHYFSTEPPADHVPHPWAIQLPEHY